MSQAPAQDPAAATAEAAPATAAPAQADITSMLPPEAQGLISFIMGIFNEAQMAMQDMGQSVAQVAPSNTPVATAAEQQGPAVS